MAGAMANRDRREVLRGVEEETFDVLAEMLTSEQWAELLTAPLKRAAAKGHRDFAQKLVGPNSDGREALRGVEEETLDLLAEELTSRQWAELLKAPLEDAAVMGKRGLAQKLVEAGAEMGDALHMAASGGYEEIVNDLLEVGASIAAKDTNGKTPLHCAAGKAEMVQLLLLKGADKDALDRYERTPLYLAVYYGRTAAALVLLAAGADASLQDAERKESVVHLAAQRGNVDVMRAAVEHGADVGAVERNQRTPLHLAAIHNQAEAIDVLLEAGASTEARNDGGSTPLHNAANAARFEALSTLVRHGADTNAQCNDKTTPLHWAAKWAGTQGIAEVVDTLLRSGADETILNDNGEAAADVVGEWMRGARQLTEVVDRVRELLANAPADRAWRRRGYLVMCRAYPGRMQQMEDTSSANAEKVRASRSGARTGRTEASGCSGAVDASPVDEGGGGDWADVVERVLGLQEEGIFRTIVGFL